MKRSTSFVLATTLALFSFACSGGTTVTGTGDPADAGRQEPTRGERAPDDTSNSDPGPTGDDSGADPETPQLLRIENLNVVEASNKYELTFVLTNDASVGVDRIQAATVSFDEMNTSFALSCTYTSQLPSAGQTTAIVTWNLWQQDWDQRVVLQDACGTNTSSDSAPPVPWSGDMTLELRGLFRDGKAFKIHATATP